MEGLNNKKKNYLIWLLVVVMIAAMIVVTLHLKSKSMESTVDQLSLGYKYLEELNYEQAVAAFEAFIEIEPKSVEAYCGLMEAYIGLGKYDEVISIYSEASNIVGTEDLLVLQNTMTEYLLEGIEDSKNNSDSTLEKALTELLIKINPEAVSVSDSAEEGSDESIVNGNEEITSLEDEASETELETDTDDNSEEETDPDAERETGDAIDITEGIEETVVGGIIHNAYAYIPFTDDEKAVLDYYINSCNQGNLRGASDGLDNNNLTELVLKYRETGMTSDVSEVHLICGDYKIYIQIYLGSQNHYYTMYILPIKSGKGYLIYKNIRLNKIENCDSETLIGYTCDCADGMFNGSFTGNKWTSFYMGGESLSQMTGSVKNGLLDGNYSYIIGIGDYSTTYSSINFSNGIPTNPYTDIYGVFGAGTQYSECGGVRTEETTSLILTSGWERRCFFLSEMAPYSGSSGSEGYTQNGGLHIYPY